MKVDFDHIDYQHLCRLVKARFAKQSEFNKLMWDGKKNHLSMSYFKNSPDITLSTMMRIIRILDITPNELFIIQPNSGETPRINGSNNIVNSSNVNSDPVHLAAENKALKMVIEELKKQNTQYANSLDLALRLGQKKDI